MEPVKRKHPRLKQYDYSQPGCYCITIHTERDRPLLSSVGRGLAPAGAELRLLPAGELCRQELFALETRFTGVKIDKYVIMPTHVHILLILMGDVAGASPCPTIPEIIGAYKSLVTRRWNCSQHSTGQKLFQTSFYETVLRNEKAYLEAWQYIEDNPQKWVENRR